MHESNPIESKSANEGTLRERLEHTFIKHYDDLYSTALYTVSSALKSRRDGRGKQIAKDALQTVITQLLENPQLIISNGAPKNLLGYLRVAVKNQVRDMISAPRYRFSREIPMGTLYEMDDDMSDDAIDPGQATGRFPHRKRSEPFTSEANPQAEVIRNEARYLLDGFYRFIVSGGTFDKKQFKPASERFATQFERGLLILRMYAENKSSLETARLLVESGYLKKFDENDPTARAQAGNLVDQTVHRMLKRLKEICWKMDPDMIDALREIESGNE